MTVDEEADVAFDNLVQTVISKLPATNLVATALQALPWLDLQDSIRLMSAITTLHCLSTFYAEGNVSLADANIVRDQIITCTKALSAKAEVQKTRMRNKGENENEDKREGA